MRRTVPSSLLAWEQACIHCLGQLTDSKFWECSSSAGRHLNPARGAHFTSAAHPSPSLCPAALQFAGAVAYAALNELLFQPKEYQVGFHAVLLRGNLC